VLNSWDGIVISCVMVLIPEEDTSIVLITILSKMVFLFTLTAVEVPIPTERFGFTERLIVSPEVSSCDVETETWVTIFSISPFTCVKFDCKECS